jgi:hypothetical protein
MTAPHNIANDLETADFPTSGRTGKTPEGYVHGWGTTAGNGRENWAPNALFIHSDGGAGTRHYRNTGTKTTAVWTADSEIKAGETFRLPDSARMLFGTSEDIEIEHNGVHLESGPPTGLWSGAPSPLDPDPFKAVTIFDDFVTGIDAGTQWVQLDDSGTGTATHGDQLGGSLNLVTTAQNDDYHARRSTAQAFAFAGRNELWFEARFKITEAATNETCWWFGLTTSDTTGGFQAAGAGPLATYDGALIYKIEGAMAIDAEASNAGTQDVETGLATFVSNTWTRVGFHVSSTDITGIVTAYFDVAGGTGPLTAHGTTMGFVRSGMVPMNLIFGVKSGGSVETMLVDYIKCVQLRTAAA